MIQAAESPLRDLFAPLAPRRQGRFAVDALHTLYWEESGAPDGVPVLVLHGGPGGGSTPDLRRFFHPGHYRIVMFDQRGAGRSTPPGECRANTTAHLIDDIENLRQFLGIRRWLIFGGSWGATLGLAYGQAHPDCCLGFILRSIFLCSREEIDWFLYGGEYFYPELFTEFVAPIPAAERSDLLAAYRRRLMSDDPACYAPAARRWSRYERGRAALLGRQGLVEDDALDVPSARLEVHYFFNEGFFRPQQLIEGMHLIQHLPAMIIQGRHDLLCPPKTAMMLLSSWPGALMAMVDDGGHTAFEPGMTAALINATETFRTHHLFNLHSGDDCAVSATAPQE